MIPLKLHIKNFLSYGTDSQVIDFTPYKLICLSGKNGHGKSALLDAITWALWGQARKTNTMNKADQGLLRLGETHMMVLFDFSLDDTVYRIRREYSHSYGKPYATLEFGIVNADDSVVPLTNKTIRDTQQTIEDTLKLDFDSFANSAFLRQGQSNEFSTKSPKERKEILASILGLNEYETIRKLAMEKIKQATIEKQALLVTQTNIEQDLLQEASITNQLIAITTELNTCTQEEIDTQQRHIALSQRNTELTVKHKEYERLQATVKQLRNDKENHRTLLRTLFTRWRTIHKKLLTYPDQQTLEQQKKQCIDTLHTHQNLLQKSLFNKEKQLKIKEELHTLYQHHNEQYTRILQTTQIELERAQSELNLLEQTQLTVKIQLQNYEKEISALQAECSMLAQAQINNQHIHTQQQSIEEQFIKRKAYYQKFIEQGNWLTTQLRELEQKKQLAHGSESPSCPLCEQNLSANRKSFLKNKFEKQEVQLHHQLTRIKKLIANLKQILIDQHKTLQQSKELTDQYTQRTVKIEELNKHNEKIQRTILELTQLNQTYQNQHQDMVQRIAKKKTELEQLKKDELLTLEKNTAYISTKQQLVQLEQEEKQIQYNAQAHQTAQQALQKIEQQLVEYEHLKQEKERQKESSQEIGMLCTLLKNLNQEEERLQKDSLLYASLNQEMILLTADEKKLHEEISILTRKKESLLQQKGRLETKQDQLAKFQDEKKVLQKKLSTLNETIDDYQIIATATSKDGIQALLIEDAIPEIEHEANQLLSKLTNNQAQIFIESLRDLKKGGAKETLDIKISDAAGIRAYELFSGGEAFRIDFALRIAISKLLARRAGTALQTLIIDEGFGSQDEEGLSNIMDALYKIQDDFHKIIIVSHLPTMKDQFPVHFVVEKRPNGSRVHVLEQG
jgi:exonuclease SbcC